MKRLLIALAVALTALFTTSCGGYKYIYVDGPVTHDTIVEHQIIRDSVFAHDSIYMHDYVKGDTIYKDKYVYKYIYKDAYKVDTFLKTSVDTITITKVQEVEKDLNAYDTLALKSGRWLFPLFIILLCVGVVIAYFKIFK